MVPTVLNLGPSGSSRGLGRAIAAAFAREKALGIVLNCTKTEVSAVDVDDMVSILGHEKILVVKADVTQLDQVR